MKRSRRTKKKTERKKQNIKRRLESHHMYPNNFPKMTVVPCKFCGPDQLRRNCQRECTWTAAKNHEGRVDNPVRKTIPTREKGHGGVEDGAVG
jgi:hypothetical protein